MLVVNNSNATTAVFTHEGKNYFLALGDKEIVTEKDGKKTIFKPAAQSDLKLMQQLGFKNIIEVDEPESKGEVKTK